MLIEEGFIPVVALDVMNEVHDEEIELLNELDVLIAKREAGEDVEAELAAKINEFVAHVEFHFSNEENMMRETGVPVYPIHKGEHDRVRAELQEAVADWRSEAGFVLFASHIRHTIPQWFADHVATMDNVTAQMMSPMMQRSA